MAVASAAGTSPSFLEVRPFFCTCSLTQETDSQESLTCFDFLLSVQPKECPGKGRKRGKGVITAPATSGRVTVPLRVTFQVLESTPSSTALSLTKCPLTAWALVPIISYSVNSSLLSSAWITGLFFFPLGPIKSPVIVIMDH